jgi:hypothetical protein
MKVTPATIATRSHQSATQLFARELRTWRRRISYFAFPAQAAARRGEWNDVAAVIDWLESADLSCRPINAYGRERGAEPHNLSLLALLILFDIACHAACAVLDPPIIGAQQHSLEAWRSVSPGIVGKVVTSDVGSTFWTWRDVQLESVSRSRDGVIGRRYSFTYVKNAENWLIVDHHSSAMPQAPK